MITFARPWLLLAVIPAAAVVIAPLMREGGGRRRWLAAALRLLALSALAAALAGASRPSSSSQTAVCILVDVSASIGDLDAVERLVGELDANIPDEIPVAVAAFAGGFRAVRPLREPRAAVGALQLAKAASGLDPARSDIAAALGRAAEMLPPEAARVVVLVSDGRENAPPAGRSAAATASRLGAAGVKVLALPAPEPGAGDLFVQDIDVPARVAAGREFSVTVTVAGTTPGTAQVVLRKLPGGRTVSRREVDLRWGESARVVFRDRAAGRGFATYVAEVLSPGDPVAANNSASAGVWTEGPSRVCLVRPRTGAPSAAAALLKRRFKGMVEVTAGPATGWTPQASELESCSVVVLENAGEHQLSEATQKRLASFVIGRAGGLLVLGGPGALGAGGLGDESPLAAVLPVSLEPPDTRRAHAIFCLDLSASMAAPAVAGAGGRSKFDCAREAVAWAAGALGETDYVSVVTFNQAAGAPFSMRPASDAGGLAKALERMVPKGGTDLLAGLELAARLLKEVEAEARHIVLLSDGEPTRRVEQALAELSVVAAGIKASGGTLDVVGISPSDEHATLLASAAKAGGGRLYLETRPERLRDHFRRIILSQTREYVRTEAFTPRPSAEHPVTKALGAPPALAARNRVSPLPGSTDIWSVPGQTPEPVLSVCSRGMGRSAVLATGLYDGWAGDLAAWPERANLLGRLVEWLEGEASEHSASARLTETEHGRRLEVTVRDKAGETLDGARITAKLDSGAWSSPVRARLVQTGLGTYASESDLPAAPPAPPTLRAPEAVRVTLRLRTEEGEDAGLLARTTLKTLPPVEITRLGADRVLLGRLAATTGGAGSTLAESPEEIASEIRRLSEAASAEAVEPLAGALALSALVLFLLELALRALRPAMARPRSD